MFCRLQHSSQEPLIVDHLAMHQEVHRLPLPTSTRGPCASCAERILGKPVCLSVFPERHRSCPRKQAVLQNQPNTLNPRPETNPTCLVRHQWDTIRE
jgi:hypothetical protein